MVDTEEQSLLIRQSVSQNGPGVYLFFVLDWQKEETHYEVRCGRHVCRMGNSIKEAKRVFQEVCDGLLQQKESDNA